MTIITFEILKEDIKNTRFILTLLNDIWLFLIVVGLFALIITGVTVDTVLFGAITTVIGYLIGKGQSAAQSYAKDRGDAEKAKIEAGEKTNKKIV